MSLQEKLRDILFEYLLAIAPFAALLALAVVVFAIVRWSRKLDAVFPDAATKYGLTFTREKRGNWLSNVLHSSQLRGVVNGTPIEVVSTYQTRGRMRMRSTVVASPAPAGLPACTINISSRPPAARMHLVPTGDARFDSLRFVTSDAPACVRALLTDKTRACLLRCKQPELRLVVNDGQLVLSFPDTPSSEAELHGPLDVLLAIDGVVDRARAS